MIYFAEENATDAAMADKELAALSRTDALFIRIAYTADREKSPWAEDTMVPTSKILSDNPSRDYKVPVGKLTIILADSYGNEYQRLNKKPTGAALQTALKKIAKDSDKANAKLQKNLDGAKAALEKGDRKGAMRLIMRNFKDGEVGHDAQVETIRTYHEILDAARGEIAEMIENKDADGIKNLQKDIGKSDLDKEIKEALAGLK